MAHAIDIHSRLVAWLKILLPLLALGILSTLFLVSRSIDSATSIPYAEVDVEELAREQRIGAPGYSGVTDTGAAVTFDADLVKPGVEGQEATAIGPSTRIDLASGQIVYITAREGSFDQTANRAALSGDALFASSDGYRMETARIVADLSDGSAQSDGEVRGTAPFGTLQAGHMALTQEDGNYVLSFDRGVKLLYEPVARVGAPLK